MHDDDEWMLQAIAQAKLAEAQDEVPVGAVIVLDGKVIGRGFNQPISRHDPTAHAEIVALRAAAKTMKNYRLPGATMYVTLEPCAMCAGAIIHARLASVVYAANDPRSGAANSVFNILQNDALNHKVNTRSGIMEEESRQLLQQFFKNKRMK